MHGYIDRILDLILSKLPEKQEPPKQHAHMTEAHYQFIVGRASAIDEIRNILREVEK